MDFKSKSKQSGWVINPVENNAQPHSCVVDETTSTAPVVINKETNEPVRFLRAYWDANRDLAGRLLECEEFRWSDDDSRYELRGSYQRYHHPLPNHKPWIHAWTKSNHVLRGGHELADETKLWTVVDGMLEDKVELNKNSFSTDQYWVELISVNGIENATRWWSEVFGSMQYHQCTDPLTNSFVPTGIPGVDSNSPSDVSTDSLVFTTAETPYPGVPYPDGYDGPEVTLSSGAAWDIKALSYKIISCPSYSGRTDGDAFWWNYDDTFETALMFLPPTTDSPRSGHLATVRVHGGPLHATTSPWVINSDNTMEAWTAFGTQHWFSLGRDYNDNDVLSYWNGGRLTCSLDKRQLDTAYVTRDATSEDHDAFLIKLNIEPYSCTSLEGTSSFSESDSNSCIIEPESATEIDNSDESNADAQAENNGQPDSTDQPDENTELTVVVTSDSTCNDPGCNSMSAGNDETATISQENNAQIRATDNTESGGGTFGGLFYLMLMVLLSLLSQNNETSNRTSRKALPANWFSIFT